MYILCDSADEKGKFDELVEQNGVQVLIDSPALMHLFGTRIDFVEDRIRYALQKAGLVHTHCSGTIQQHAYGISFDPFFACAGLSLPSATQTRKVLVGVGNLSRHEC